jgi:hypothetical protein
MNDPFEILRAELVRAAARTTLVSSRRRWAWLQRPSRPVAVVIAALVVGGGATAAAVSFSASSSQPLSGQVPGHAAPFRPGETISVAGHRYTIRVTPNLSSGSSGWEVWTAYQGPPFGGGLGGGGGGGYPTPTNPIFQGSGVAPWNILVGTQKASATVGFVLTGPQVAAVRIGTQTIRTFTSPELPAGDRAAVFFLAPHAALPIVGWRPGQPINSRMLLPQLGPGPSSKLVRTTAVLPLDSSGAVLATAAPGPDYGFVRGWSFWQAPSAVTPNIHEPPYHGSSRPRAGACELTQHGLPGLTPEWGSTITSIPTVKNYLGELFVSCVSTEYYLRGWPMVAALLLDAGHPGIPVGPIPGAQPIPDNPSTVDFAAASLSARRVGSAWLVVQGGSGTAQRLRVLEALQIHKLDLRKISPDTG